MRAPGILEGETTMFCARCGMALPETGGCPSCDQPRPNYCQNCGKALPETGDCHFCVDRRSDIERKDQVAVPALPVAPVGCGLGGATLGILVGIGVGIMICIGLLSTFLTDVGKILGIRK